MIQTRWNDFLKLPLISSMTFLFQFITDEVTNHLFEDKKKPHSGMDLASLNIQRSRDHGIPGYNLYRAICNLTRFYILQLIYLSNHKEFHFFKKGLLKTQFKSCIKVNYSIIFGMNHSPELLLKQL